jgi:hypothetical protein
MFRRLLRAVKPSKGDSLARAFRRLGWTGFWVQVTIGSLPIVMLVYYLVLSRTTMVSRTALPFVEYLVLANLLILLFTIFWSYRYARLGARMSDPHRRPDESAVIGIVWTGVVASAVGMLFSMIVMLTEAASLLFLFLKAPQGGIPVIQTTGAEAGQFVSSIDMVSLMALTLMLLAELIVLVISLWLLFRTTMGSPELAGSTG